MPRVGGFFRSHGKRAKDMVCYEWFHYKRVLQTNVKQQWQPRRMTSKRFYKRVYRDDAKAAENWSIIAKRVPLERPVETEELGNKQKWIKSGFVRL